MTAAHVPKEPSEDQLLAMAYADGELDAADRRAFESRLASDPALALEVAQHKKLDLLARSVAPPEPMDHEWRRIEASPLHKTGLDLGWNLVLFGLVGLYLWGLLTVVSSPMHLILKALVTALMVGLGILFLIVLRARWRTQDLDPYTEVRR